MQRVLSTATLLGLLVATAAAFAITEHLKLVQSPIYGTFVSKTLSPTCSCARSKAVISVKLRRGDRVTMTIVDPHRRVVRTLASDVRLARGRARFVWDGSTDAGGRAPDGAYQPEIHLAQQHRTILMPNRIDLDTRPPQVVEVRASRSVLSPDGDRVGDSIRIAYKLDEPAHVRIYLGSQLLVRSRGHKPADTVTWFGIVSGKPLKPGSYTLTVGASDLAGNVTPAADRKTLVVTVRYIRLLRGRIRVAPGARFSVGVDTDARRYGWTLGARHGSAHGKVLRLRAPAAPGTYGLVVSERKHTARATVVVGSGT